VSISSVSNQDFSVVLPSEMFLKIFNLLLIEDLSNVSKVCHFWHDQAKFLLQNYKNMKEFSQKIKKANTMDQWTEVIKSENWEHLPLVPMAARKKIVSVCVSKIFKLKNRMIEFMIGSEFLFKIGSEFVGETIGIFCRKLFFMEIMELLELLCRIKRTGFVIPMKWSESFELESEGVNKLLSIFFEFISLIRDESRKRIKNDELKKDCSFGYDKLQSWPFASSILADFNQAVNLVVLKYKEYGDEDPYGFFFEEYKNSELKFSKDSCLFVIPSIMEEIIKENGSSSEKDRVDLDLKRLEEVTRYFST
jgi:hypothetical protein